MRIPFSVLLLLMLSGAARAHLDTLYYPQTGASLTGGTTVVVHWEIGNLHNGITVELSTDDKTWAAVSGTLGKTATTYNWKVPMTTTSRARIRICQVSNPGEHCTDADSVSNPVDGPTYWLVSGRFNIQSATALAPSAPEAAAPDFARGSAPFYMAPRRGESGFQVVDLNGRVLIEF